MAALQMEVRQELNPDALECLGKNEGRPLTAALKNPEKNAWKRSLLFPTLAGRQVRTNLLAHLDEASSSNYSKSQSRIIARTSMLTPPSAETNPTGAWEPEISIPLRATRGAGSSPLLLSLGRSCAVSKTVSEN